MARQTHASFGINPINTGGKANVTNVRARLQTRRMC
jgi:hypothetical protein